MKKKLTARKRARNVLVRPHKAAPKVSIERDPVTGKFSIRELRTVVKQSFGAGFKDSFALAADVFRAVGRVGARYITEEERKRRQAAAAAASARQ